MNPRRSKSATALEISGHVNQNNVGNGDCMLLGVARSFMVALACLRLAPPNNGYVCIATGIRVLLLHPCCIIFCSFHAETRTKFLGKYPSCCSTAILALSSSQVNGDDDDDDDDDEIDCRDNAKVKFSNSADTTMPFRRRRDIIVIVNQACCCVHTVSKGHYL
jgi:hypothetical protein